MDMNFQVGDKAVHPAHGVGEVTAIERREVAGNAGSFYVLKILDTGMKVMVPTRAVEAVGLRGVMSHDDSEAVLAVFRTSGKPAASGPWNRRQRTYNDMLKSGSPGEVALVLRDLYRVKFGHTKELSYGERRLMDQARGLLLKELAIARRSTERDVEREIETLCCAEA
jgi:CarD family transcriptional regulator